MSLDAGYHTALFFFFLPDELMHFFSNRTPDEVLAAKGVKPTLSPNLNTLALVEVPYNSLLC